MEVQGASALGSNRKTANARIRPNANLITPGMSSASLSSTRRQVIGPDDVRAQRW